MIVLGAGALLTVRKKHEYDWWTVNMDPDPVEYSREVFEEDLNTLRKNGFLVHMFPTAGKARRVTKK